MYVIPEYTKLGSKIMKKVRVQLLGNANSKTVNQQVLRQTEEQETSVGRQLGVSAVEEKRGSSGKDERGERVLPVAARCQHLLI
jgi:hypothetical protein